MSLLLFDTYINSPAVLSKLNAQSKGNVDANLEIGTQRFQRLADRRPARFGRYLKGWMARIEHLRQITTKYALAH